MANLRERIEAEFDEAAAHNPAAWSWEIRNRNRVVDWWLLFSIAWALRSIHLLRYQKNPAARDAIIRARAAVNEAAEAVRHDYRERSYRP